MQSQYFDHRRTLLWWWCYWRRMVWRKGGTLEEGWQFWQGYCHRPQWGSNCCPDWRRWFGCGWPLCNYCSPSPGTLVLLWDRWHWRQTHWNTDPSKVKSYDWVNGQSRNFEHLLECWVKGLLQWRIGGVWLTVFPSRGCQPVHWCWALFPWGYNCWTLS